MRRRTAWLTLALLVVAPTRGADAQERVQGVAKRLERGREALQEAGEQRARLRRAIDQSRKLRRELQETDTASLGRTLRSFADNDVSPRERRELLERASGEPLTEVATTIARNLVEPLPEGTFETLGRRASELDGGESEDSSSLVKVLIGKDFEQIGRQAEQALRNPDSPEFQQHVDRALDVLRFAAKVEGDALTRVSAELPPEQRPQARRAVTDFSADVARTVMREVFYRNATPQQRRALRDTVDGIVELTATAIDAELDQTARKQRLSEATQKLKDARRTIEGLQGLPAPESADDIEWTRLGEQLAERQRRFVRELDSTLEMTPESREAAAKIGGDIRLAARFMVGVTRARLAAQSRNTPPEQRAEELKRAFESMGPMVVKLLQTLANFRSMVEISAEQPEDENVLWMALSGLQDEATPMPMDQVRTQVEKSLDGRSIEEAFVKFEPEPFASASIAQVHRAEIEKPRIGREPKRMEVAVKVQRPDLKEEFDRAVRGIKLALDGLRQKVRDKEMGERLDQLQDRWGEGKAEDLVEFGFDIADRTLEDFVRSFEAETDFEREARQMKRFARRVGAESNIYVPAVFDKFSGETVLTMEYVRGDRVGAWAERAERARDARDEPLSSDPLPERGAAEAARERARDFAIRNYGLEPESMDVTETSTGFTVETRFDHEAQRTATIRVDRGGGIRAEGTVPDLSEEGTGRLRDGLLKSFVTQMLVHREIHGDLHQGNLAVLPDGKTVVTYDFGQMVRIGLRDFAGPARFTLGLALNRPRPIAKSLVRASDQHKHMTRRERRRAVKRAQEAIRDVLQNTERRFSEETVAEVIKEASMASKLTLNSTYLQLLKTSLSFAGNVAALDDISEDTPTKAVTGRILKGTAKATMAAPARLGRGVNVFKRWRVRRMLRDARGD